MPYDSMTGDNADLVVGPPSGIAAGLKNHGEAVCNADCCAARVVRFVSTTLDRI